MSAASASSPRGAPRSMSKSPVCTVNWEESAEQDVREEEVRPVRDEAEEEDERDHRLGERQADAEECPPLAAAVDAGRLEERRRQRGSEVDVREVDPEREKRKGQDDRQRAPDQVDGVELQEDREHEGRRRHEHRDHRRREEQPATGKAPDGEPIAGRDRGDQGDRGRAEGVDERVFQPAPEHVIVECVQPLPRDHDVVEAAEGKRSSGRELVIRPGRREDEPHERDAEEDREDEQHDAAPSESEGAPSPVKGRRSKTFTSGADPNRCRLCVVCDGGARFV